MYNNQSISENKNYKLGDLNKECRVAVKNGHLENLENKSFSLKNETFKSDPDSDVKINGAINEKAYQDLINSLEGVHTKLIPGAGATDGDGYPMFGEEIYREYQIREKYKKFLEDVKQYQGTDEEMYGKALVDVRDETRSIALNNIPLEVRRIYEQLAKEGKIQHIFTDSDFEIVNSSREMIGEGDYYIAHIIYENTSDHVKYCLGDKIEPGQFYELSHSYTDYGDDYPSEFSSWEGRVYSRENFDRLKIAKEFLNPRESEYDESEYDEE